MQRVDEELYGGHQALLSEGFPPSMSVFLVGCTPTWGFKATYRVVLLLWPHLATWLMVTSDT